MIKKNDHEKSNISIWTIGHQISEIRFQIKELLDLGPYIIPNFDNIETLRWKWESNTRELLKDIHKTFELFLRWLSIWSDQLKQWNKVSIWLYKEDIGHNEFVSWITQATDEGKYASWLTLDISWDPYGRLDRGNLSNLQNILLLWVWIGIEDFCEKTNWEINIEGITQLIKWHIRPKYIKISNTVLTRLKNNNVAPYVKCLYERLMKMWIKIIEYISWDTRSQDTMEIDKQKIANILTNSATIEYEPMMTFEWKVWAEELLVRFDNWLRTDIGLSQLKELWHTQGLVVKMLWAAVEKAKQGKRASLNLYIKDLWSENLITLVNTIIQDLPREYRKNIIFEILEEKYGVVNEIFIKNIYTLQNTGFSIAIDDLYVSKMDQWMSLEILDNLLEFGIYPDYIKLDGKHSMAIQDGSISNIELDRIKTLIWQFALVKPTIVVIEWIQDMEHAEKINAVFQGINWIILIFQGREINIENFWKNKVNII
jgi:EAL domain-containing protein (putative c-di-GMP-specific phosphodiesterase class I)